MKKILVTTDFSEASKSAMRFAIQWSTQQKLQIVFLHVHYCLRPTSWSKDALESYVKKELGEAGKRLKAFVADVYQEASVAPVKINTRVIEGLDADVSILYHANKNSGYDCICISTRGAGKLKKFLGTNTGNLITRSELPVLAVPAEYKVSPISKIMFATDMVNFQQESQKVINFAKPLKAKIEMVHFAWPNEVMFDEKAINNSFKKHFRYGIEFSFEQNDAVRSLIERLEEKIKQNKPSVVVMFTQQQRTFFQRLFLSSKSEELSFKTKVPLLVYNKEV